MTARKSSRVRKVRAAKAPSTPMKCEPRSAPQTPAPATPAMSSRTSNADEARSDVAFENEAGNTLAAEVAQTCCKCGVGVTAANLGSLGKKSKQVIHTACGSFYKQIAKKISKDPVYKSWWESRTFDAMCINIA